MNVNGERGTQGQATVSSMFPIAALLAVCASLPLTVRVHPDVAAALDAGRAVVALESTIISHGMPYPANVQTAREVEEVVRNSGAVPATIASGMACAMSVATNRCGVMRSG